MARSLPFFFTTLVALACTTTTRDSTTSFLTGEGGTGGSSSSTGPDDSKLDFASADIGPISEIAEVFGHSADTLYRLHPQTKAVTVVGSFSGCQSSIIDIALDADSNMFGTAYSRLYSIDRTTGDCTLIAEGDYPTSLSFVPIGTVDANEEALVGFVEELYVRIDVATGEISELGALSDGLRSSGDLVSVKDGDTWLTVVGPGCETGDCIVSIDPGSGDVIQNYGPLPYQSVFGLAFWAGRAYGFSADGQLFEIEFGDTNVSTKLIDVPGAPPDLSFFGAGSTTSAPPTVG